MKDGMFTLYVKDGMFCHFMASMISGLVTTIASMPVDIAKTRIQNMKMIGGKPEFEGVFHVFSNIVKKRSSGPMERFHTILFSFRSAYSSYICLLRTI